MVKRCMVLVHLSPEVAANLLRQALAGKRKGRRRRACLQDEAVQEKLPNLWEFGVDDGNQGRKDGREGRGGHL